MLSFAIPLGARRGGVRERVQLPRGRGCLIHPFFVPCIGCDGSTKNRAGPDSREGELGPRRAYRGEQRPGRERDRPRRPRERCPRRCRLSVRKREGRPSRSISLFRSTQKPRAAPLWESLARAGVLVWPPSPPLSAGVRRLDAHDLGASVGGRAKGANLWYLGGGRVARPDGLALHDGVVEGERRVRVVARVAPLQVLVVVPNRVHGAGLLALHKRCWLRAGRDAAIQLGGRVCDGVLGIPVV
mmetsp:Transcript_2948/g.8587  ORF Transcript_2948/g.8587 Transcript_2948/m.8587 type:complete len:243 (-) Transcript_2948:132-860(-)